MPAPSPCPEHDGMVDDEVMACAAYWSKFHAASASQAELDRLLEAAARESAAIEVHIKKCRVCRVKR